MALAAACVWEVRTTGASTNGGGFKTGASGTDWSQQATAQYAVADGVTNGTTTITSATANFGTDVVGNLIYVSGGTGSITADWYEITARTNSTTITVDRSTGLTTGTGVTLNIGGALSNINTPYSKAVSGNIIWVKYGTYVLTSVLTATAVTNVKLIGYDSTRGDATANRPTIDGGSLASTTLVTLVQQNSVIKNFIVDGKSNTSIQCVSISAQYTMADKVKVVNFTNGGILGGNTCFAVNCEASGGSGSLAAFSGGVSYNCYAHDCTCNGFSTMYSARCIADTCAVGFAGPANNAYYWGCTAYGNTSDGFNQAGNFGSNLVNCLAVGNGGYGFNGQGTAAFGTFYTCAGFNNTSGNHDSAFFSIDGFVSLSGDPFTNATSGDFSLNNTAGAGAACRAAGIPGAFPGGLTTGYLDIGAAQHQDSGSGGAIILSGLGQIGVGVS